MLLETAPPPVEILRENGALEQPASGSTFSLHCPDTVWFVQCGKLDLFLVDTRDGEPTGARYPAHRVEPGHAVFGMDASPSTVRMMAAVSPSTEIVKMSWERVRGMIAAGNEFALSLLEDWIANITSALAREMAPGGYINLEADRSVQVPPNHSRAISCQKVLWIKHQRGHSSFLAQADLPAVNGSGFFPVSRYGWLEAEAGSEIEALPSAKVAAADPEWNGLREFHALVMACLMAQREKTGAAMQRTMREREAADRATLRTSMLRLAAPLHKVRQVEGGYGDCRNPLYLACQAIGNQLGAVMKPHPDMLRGVEMADPVAAIAKASNVRARAVVLDGTWWNEENPPLLGYREADNSPVALLRRSTGMDIFDPVTEQFSPLNADTARSLKPYAYVFYRPFGAQPLTAWDLVRFGLRGCAKEIGVVLSGSLAAGFLALLAPVATALIFDDLIPGAEREQLLQMSILLAIITLSSALLMYVRDFAVLRLEGKLDAALQSALWDRVLCLPVSFFRNYSAGDLALRSLGISRIRQILTGHLLSAALSGIFSVFSFLLLFVYSWPMALLAGWLVGMAVGFSIVCGWVQVRKQRGVYMLQGVISSRLVQFITGIGKLRTSGTERRAFSVWAKDFSAQKECYTSGRKVSIILTCFNSVYPIACLGVIFLCHGLFVNATAPMTTGRFLAFISAFMQFLGATLAFISTVMNAINIVPIYERVKPILNATPEVTEAKANPGTLTGAIEINNLSFGYSPDLPPILRDISLKIEPGQFVAFVGSSGGGKSTLFRLLLGFETPGTGAVYYDGQDLSGLDIQSVRKQIGVVLQSSKPFVGSLFTNIVGSGAYTLDDAQEAARLAGLEADIQRMPMGLHTVVADGGAGISGGQRQRLMIARALIGRPRILLFDEATSALDNRTQESVSKSLESLQATRIVIAHRLSTIINADRIFVLDKGQVVQQGTYQQLIVEEGLFQTLAKRQMS